jgi:ATP-dependent Clp protease ATP-binding subunit ClpC
VFCGRPSATTLGRSRAAFLIALSLTGCLFQHLTVEARRVVLYGLEHARNRGSSTLGSEHLLLGLVQEDPTLVERVAMRVGFTRDALLTEIDRVSPRKPVGENARADLPLAADAKAVIETASRSRAEATTKDLLAAMLTTPGSAATILSTLGVTRERITAELTAQ